MKKVGIITTSRADYSIFLPLLKELEADCDIILTIFAMGMHVSPKFGFTVERIKSDGFDTIILSDSLRYGDSSYGVSRSTGETLVNMSQALSDFPQNIIICLGDRFEMFGAVSAVIPFGIPVIHIHGGETTEGAIDEKYRHAITKLSDVHFTSCEVHKRRVIQMGANPKSVFNFGSLGVENLKTINLLNKDEINEKFGFDVAKKTILGTYQSVTTELEKSEYYVNEFCRAIKELDYQFILTLGNADTAGEVFIDKISRLGKENPEKFKVFENLGIEGYLSTMKLCEMVIGNSSSGLIEAASFNKPVVNIGSRQKGREFNKNVIHTKEDAVSIKNGVFEARKLIGKKFDNIYAQYDTAKRMLEVIKGPQCQLNYHFYETKI
jgi:GDP/UDP-N,N'-diacetylbacillosamine 2-epimerase (hydrolysing)